MPLVLAEFHRNGFDNGLFLLDYQFARLIHSISTLVDHRLILCCKVAGTRVLYRAIIIILNVLEHPGRSSCHVTTTLSVIHVAVRPLFWCKQRILRVVSAIPAAIGLTNFGGLFVICLYRHVLSRFIYVVGVEDI